MAGCACLCVCGGRMQCWIVRELCLLRSASVRQRRHYSQDRKTMLRFLIGMLAMQKGFDYDV
eukprot:3639154-Amphidinium_carterae.3